MSNHPEFREAMAAAKKRADRRGLVINWFCWRNGHLDYRCGKPHKPEVEEAPRSSRGAAAQGTLL
jgi:hypothetical protein